MEYIIDIEYDIDKILNSMHITFILVFRFWCIFWEIILFLFRRQCTFVLLNIKGIGGYKMATAEDNLVTGETNARPRMFKLG